MVHNDLIQFAIDNTETVLKSFTTQEIISLNGILFTTREQILAKYGKFQLNDKGLDLYTNSQIIQRMPNETRIMFFAINNSNFLIELSLILNSDLTEDNKRMRAELTKQQIKIIELQTKLKEK